MIPIILKNSFVIVFLFRSQKGSKVYEDNLERFVSMCVDLYNWAKFPFERKHESHRDTEVIQKSRVLSANTGNHSQKCFLQDGLPASFLYK